MGVLTGAPRMATVRALIQVVVAELARDEALRALSEIPSLSEALRRIVAKRLADNEDVLSERLARYVKREVRLAN